MIINCYVCVNLLISVSHTPYFTSSLPSDSKFPLWMTLQHWLHHLLSTPVILRAWSRTSFRSQEITTNWKKHRTQNDNAPEAVINTKKGVTEWKWSFGEDTGKVWAYLLFNCDDLVPKGDWSNMKWSKRSCKNRCGAIFMGLDEVVNKWQKISTWSSNAALKNISLLHCHQVFMDGLRQRGHNGVLSWSCFWGISWQRFEFLGKIVRKETLSKEAKYKIRIYVCSDTTMGTPGLTRAASAAFGFWQAHVKGTWTQWWHDFHTCP